MRFVCILILLSSSLIFFPCNAAHAQTLQFVLKPGRLIDHLDNFSEGLACAGTNSQYGYVDTNANWAIPARFSEAGSFHEGMARVGMTDKAYHTRYGFIDRLGKLCIPFQYEEAHDFSAGLAAVKKGSSWVYINKSGAVVLNSSYIFKRQIVNEAEKDEREIDEPQDFNDGLIVMRQGNLWGYADSTGKMIIPYQFRFASGFSDGMARVGDVNDESDICYIDKNGKIVIRINAIHGEDFHDGMAAFEIKGPGSLLSDGAWSLWGFMDKQGHVVIPPQYSEEPRSFDQGISFLQVNGHAGNNGDGFIRMIDRAGGVTGKILLCNSLKKCIYDSGLSFSEGLLPVRLNDLWGYINAAGEWVIQPIFLTALPFRDGLAIVETDSGELAIIRNPLKTRYRMPL